MEEKTEFEVTIFEGQRSWYELVLAAVFFGISVYLLLQALYAPFIIPSLIFFLLKLRLVAGVGLYCFAMGLRFSITKNMLIDIDTHTIVSRYVVGIFSYDIRTKTKEFEYVAFFKDKRDCYQTYLWYTGNKHYVMYAFEEREPAFQFALNVSNKLNIDLLDSCEKGNFKWIDKSKV